MTKDAQGSGTGHWSVVRIVPVAILAAGLVAFFMFDIGHYLDFAVLKDNREALLARVGRDPVLSVILFVLVYAAAVSLSVPSGAVMTMVGGFLFGTALATGAVVIGATLGATVLFLAARTALGDVLHARAGPGIRRMEAGFQENPLNYLLVLRLVPLFPFWLVNLVPAFLGISLRTFVVGTFVGIIPGTWVFASVGNGLGALLDAGRTPDLDLLYHWDILIPLVGLAALALVPVVYKMRKAARVRRRDGEPGSR